MAIVALVAATLAPAAAQTGASPQFTVAPSVDQVAVTGAPEGESAVLRAADGDTVATRTVDALGSVLFRDVPPGAGYVVDIDGHTSGPVTVLDPATTPPQELYAGQQLQPGFGYLKT